MIKNYLRVLAYLTGFSAVCIIAAFLFLELAEFDKEIEVPLITGKNISEAEELLNSNKLSLKVDGEDYDPEVPVGYIIRQDVKPGESVKRGTDIKVFLSKGSDIFSMPSFEGQDLEEVKKTLVNLEMEAGKITRVHSDKVGKDRIIAQRPLPGNVGSNKVNFLVSAGRYRVSYKCPSLINMSLDDARDLTEVLGLKLTASKKGSKVIFQKPEAGTIMNWGDSVEVTLGRGWGLWF
jgi:serine/threonine-protein kinase